MSDEQQSAPAETPDETNPWAWPTEPPTKDSLLQLYLDLAEDGVNIGVTVAVPGGLVTGTLVSAATWLRAVAQSMDPSPQGERRGLAKAFDQMAQEFDDHPRGEDDPGPWYLHLLDAQHVSGGVFVPNPGKTPWRVRLTEVVGWTTGNMSRG